MKKLILSLLLTAAFGFCFAPINLGGVPAGMHKREHSESERAAQQSHLPQIGEVGGVPGIDGGTTAPAMTNDPNARNAVANAMRPHNGVPQQSESAKRDLAVAAAALKANGPASKVGTFAWAGVFAAIGFGIVFGLKKWADKALPNPTSASAKKSANW
ncbi:MAG: hypothetical protein H7Y17_07945 [Chlorobia bacterium]|nr:hypothetical protein [Fimbriimonadaceae bacterium]